MDLDVSARACETSVIIDAQTETELVAEHMLWFLLVSGLGIIGGNCRHNWQLSTNVAQVLLQLWVSFCMWFWSRMKA